MVVIVSDIIDFTNS